MIDKFTSQPIAVRVLQILLALIVVFPVVKCVPSFVTGMSFEKKREQIIASLFKENPIRLSPKEFLVQLGSGTELQQKQFVNSMLGRTVVWKLEIEQVKVRQGDYVEIITPTGKNYMTGTVQSLGDVVRAITEGAMRGQLNPVKQDVGTKLKVYLRDQQDREFISRLNKQEYILVRGKIKNIYPSDSEVVLDPVVFEDVKNLEYMSPVKAKSAADSIPSEKLLPASSFLNYDTKVTVTGTVVVATNSDIENPFKYLAIKLQQPVGFNKNNSNDAVPSISLLQLTASDSTQAKIRSLVNKKVTLDGIAFHSDNANHATKVLLIVNSIELLK